MSPKLEYLIHILEWVRIEEFVTASWHGVGRPPHERAWLANAFVAKMVLGLTTTTHLLERKRLPNYTCAAAGSAGRVIFQGSRCSRLSPVASLGSSAKRCAR